MELGYSQCWNYQKSRRGEGIENDLLAILIRDLFKGGGGVTSDINRIGWARLQLYLCPPPSLPGKIMIGNVWHFDWNFVKFYYNVNYVIAMYTFISNIMRTNCEHNSICLIDQQNVIDRSRVVGRINKEDNQTS